MSTPLIVVIILALTAIIGVGALERFGKVRWGVEGDILSAWVLAIRSVDWICGDLFNT